MLVAMVPFFTMAQKRSKKDKKPSSEQVKKSKSNYEFMVIKGVEFKTDQAKINSKSAVNPDEVEEMQMKNLLKPHAKIMISFDTGDLKNSDMLNLMKKARSMRTMAAAVKEASELGWTFKSANVLDKDIATIHYYYMIKPL